MSTYRLLFQWASTKKMQHCVWSSTEQVSLTSGQNRTPQDIAGTFVN